MSIFGSLLKLIKAIIKSVINIIKKFLKKFWLIILIVVALYFFGPMIGAWLTHIGSPAWIAGLFSGFPGWVASVGEMFMTGVGKLGALFMKAELGTQAGIVFGALGLLAPNELGEFVGEVVDVVGDITGPILSAIARNAWPLLLAVGGFFLLKGKSGKTTSKETVYVENAKNLR